MKFKHSINAISLISFTSRKVQNPVTGEDTGQEIDNWEDIPHSTAKGLEELQNRINKIDEALAQVGGVDKMLAIFEWVAKQEEKKGLKPPKDEPAPMLSIETAKK